MQEVAIRLVGGVGGMMMVRAVIRLPERSALLLGRLGYSMLAVGVVMDSPLEQFRNYTLGRAVTLGGLEKLSPVRRLRRLGLFRLVALGVGVLYRVKVVSGLLPRR